MSASGTSIRCKRYQFCGMTTARHLQPRVGLQMTRAIGETSAVQSLVALQSTITWRRMPICVDYLSLGDQPDARHLIMWGYAHRHGPLSTIATCTVLQSSLYHIDYRHTLTQILWTSTSSVSWNPLFGSTHALVSRIWWFFQPSKGLVLRTDWKYSFIAVFNISENVSEWIPWRGAI